MSSPTFKKITNNDIYNNIIEIDKKIDRIEKHVIETNGKVKLNRWAVTTAITLIVAVICAFCTHLI